MAGSRTKSFDLYLCWWYLEVLEKRRLGCRPWSKKWFIGSLSRAIIHLCCHSQSFLPPTSILIHLGHNSWFIPCQPGNRFKGCKRWMWIMASKDGMLDTNIRIPFRRHILVKITYRVNYRLKNHQGATFFLFWKSNWIHLPNGWQDSLEIRLCEGMFLPLPFDFEGTIELCGFRYFF